MNRPQKSMFTVRVLGVLAIITVAIGGRIVFMGDNAGVAESPEAQVRAGLFSVGPSTTNEPDYPTQDDIRDALAR